MYLWTLLATAALAWALKDGDLNPLNWIGGVTTMSSGKKANNGLATRAQIFKDEVFLCVPRFKRGIEATLLKTCMKPRRNDGSICLEPFPSWKEQTEGKCNCLQSAVDLFLDPAGMLWVLDSGTAPDNENGHKCQPKVVGYDVRNGKIIKEIILSEYLTPESRLQFLLADYSSSGECFVYISDAGTRSIIVFDITAGKSHKVLLPPEVIPEPALADVLYMALIRKSNGENYIYYTYRSGHDMFAIDSKSLQFDKSSTKSLNIGKKTSRIIILGTDDWECIYFRYENKTEVYKWNTSTPFLSDSFKLVDNVKTDLIPTHAMTDYSKGVMRLMRSNLHQYVDTLSSEKADDPINSLAIMQLN